MVIKIISLALVLCAVELFIIGLDSPSDPLFLIISNNPFVVSIRIFLILAAVILAFKTRFKYKISPRVAIWMGVVLMMFGAGGMISQSITDELSAFVKYLDFWLLFLVGVVFNLAALSLKPGTRQLRLQPIINQRLPKSWSAKIGSINSPNLPEAKK